MSADLSRHLRALVWPRKGAFALGLLLLFVNRAAGLVLPGSLKFLIDDVVLNHRAALLYPLAAAVGAGLIVHAVSQYALERLFTIPGARLIAILRAQLQAHIGRLPIRYLDSTKTGVLVSRIMKDAEGVRNLVGTGMVELIGGFITAAIVLVILLRINAILTAVVLGFLVAFMLFSKRTLARVRPIFRQQAEINAEVTGRLTESLSGIRVVKGFHGERREADTFHDGAMRLFAVARRQILATSLATGGATVLLALGTTTVIIVAGQMLLRGALTVGDAFAFLLFVGLAINPVFSLVQFGTQVTEALAGLERMQEVLREEPEDVDPRRTLAIGPIDGHVTFDRVTFEYEPGRPVLKDLSLDAPPGTVTALVGSSGAGKSTLTSLVAAFASPMSGTVRVDGRDLSIVRLDSFRTQIGVVLQDNFLFDGTIRDNILFGRPEATAEDVRQAARIARVDEFASKLPLDLETVIGERGVKLSGGQRQRIAIARAVLADPRILILDEATSSLDSESEELIQEGLAALMRGRTTFVIAHRLSTIRLADQILVLEAGVIVERGTHGELIARRGRYFDLHTRQMKSEATGSLAADTSGLAPGLGPGPAVSAAYATIGHRT